jgi:hypothetical protein
MIAALRTMAQDDSGSVPAAERIAAAMIRCLDLTGQCGIHELRAAGFSLDELARYWPEACKIVEGRRSRR